MLWMTNAAVYMFGGDSIQFYFVLCCVVCIAHMRSLVPNGFLPKDNNDFLCAFFRFFFRFRFPIIMGFNEMVIVCGGRRGIALSLSLFLSPYFIPLLEYHLFHQTYSDIECSTFMYMLETVFVSFRNMIFDFIIKSTRASFYTRHIWETNQRNWQHQMELVFLSRKISDNNNNNHNHNADETEFPHSFIMLQLKIDSSNCAREEEKKRYSNE